MAELDLELLASIASGGLGRWQQDVQRRTVYVKSEDCVGEAARGGEWSTPARQRQPPTARLAPPPPLRMPRRRSGCLVFLCLPATTGCLRDLQRFFRYDDPETRPAFFAVSKYNFARRWGCGAGLSGAVWRRRLALLLLRLWAPAPAILWPPAPTRCRTAHSRLLRGTLIPRYSPLATPLCPAPRASPLSTPPARSSLACSDLVPLIVTYPEDYDVVYNARALGGQRAV